MPTTAQPTFALTTPCLITVQHDVRTFTLPLDNSNPKAWQDFLKYLLEHPEIIMALIQLIAMLLGGLTPPPPPTP